MDRVARYFETDTNVTDGKLKLFECHLCILDTLGATNLSGAGRWNVNDRAGSVALQGSELCRAPQPDVEGGLLSEVAGVHGDYAGDLFASVR